MQPAIGLEKEIAVHIDDNVLQKMSEIKKRSKRWGVEQDLFLCGQIARNTATVTDCIDPVNDFWSAIIFYVPPEQYSPKVREKLLDLSDELSILALPLPDQILSRAIPILTNRLLRLIVEKHLEDTRSEETYLPSGTQCFLANANGFKRATPEDVITNPIGITYGPDFYYHPSLAHNQLPPDIFSQRNVIGHYHIHPQDSLPPIFSEEDMVISGRYQRNLKLKHFLIGVSDQQNELFRII